MESTKEHMSLTDALSEARIKTLPEEWREGSGIWVKAIAKVTKCNAKTNYVLVENSGDGTPTIIKDFGTPAKVVRFDGIYPYYFLGESRMPELKNKRDITVFLENGGYEKEYVTGLLSPTDKDGNPKPEQIKEEDHGLIKKMVHKVAIKNYLCELNERLKAHRIYGKGNELAQGKAKENVG